MPRIRTIKPEICLSVTVASLSLPAQLIWERMWCFCDDAGRLEYNPNSLKGQVVPLIKSITVAKVDSCISEIVTAGLCLRYHVGAREYLQVTNWSEHQKINNPSKTRLPPPPAKTRKNSKNYGSPTVGLP